MAVVQFRVDDQLKEDASAVFEKLGLDFSSAMRMFLKRVVFCNGIPFPMVLLEDAYRATGAIQAVRDMQKNLCGKRQFRDDVGRNKC